MRESYSAVVECIMEIELFPVTKILVTKMLLDFITISLSHYLFHFLCRSLCELRVEKWYIYTDDEDMTMTIMCSSQC